MSNFKERIIGAAKLNPAIYEEVEADTTSMGQAMAVVVLSSIAAGVGSMGVGGIGRILMGLLGALIGWYLWAILTYLIGTKILPQPQTKADLGQLLRTTGFSSSPGLIRVLGFIPGLGRIVFLVAAIWMLVAMVVAVRQALDYTSTARALGVCFIGWIIQALIVLLFVSLVGGLARPL